MSLGDIEDFRRRLRKLIPTSWFPNPAPILWGLLSGPAYVLQSSYALFKYARAQARMATTTDAFLEISALDFVGLRIQRRAGETDISFRGRIINETLRPRNTREAIIIAITELTGRPPQIFAPWNTGDVGALDVGTLACDVAGCVGTGIDAQTSIPFTYFINVFRPLVGSGITVSDAEIYAAVNAVTAAGITAWVSIQSDPGSLDFSNPLDTEYLPLL